MLPRTRLIQFALTYVLFVGVLLEGAARLMLGVPALEKRIWVPDDYGMRRAWVKRHAAGGREAFYGFDRFDASTGWRSRSNIRGMRVFGDRILNTNGLGFRGTRDFAYAKTPGKTRILILGDSFTFGDDVSDDETYSYFLEHLLPNTEIMNVAVHGYGHDQMLILLKEVGVRYHADIVMLGFVSADMSRNLLTFRDYAKPSYRMKDGQLVRQGTPVPTPEVTLRWDWARPRVIDLYSAVRYRLWGGPALVEEGERMTRALLAEIVRVTVSVGAMPIFVYLPINSEIERVTDPTMEEQWFFATCRERAKLKCLSARPAFNEKLRRGATFRTGSSSRAS